MLRYKISDAQYFLPLLLWSLHKKQKIYPIIKHTLGKDWLRLLPMWNEEPAWKFLLRNILLFFLLLLLFESASCWLPLLRLLFPIDLIRSLKAGVMILSLSLSESVRYMPWATKCLSPRITPELLTILLYLYSSNPLLL